MYYIAQAACGGCERARAMDFSAASSRPSAMEKRAPPSSKAAAKAVNRGAREGPAQLMSMSSTEEASPFTLAVAAPAGAPLPLHTAAEGAAAEEEDEGSLL